MRCWLAMLLRSSWISAPRSWGRLQASIAPSHAHRRLLRPASCWENLPRSVGTDVLDAGARAGQVRCVGNPRCGIERCGGWSQVFEAPTRDSGRGSVAAVVDGVLAAIGTLAERHESTCSPPPTRLSAR